ncbi:MAG: hypothetical protein H5T86_10245 [Armatimonadetes bacterium]|nr:hypothetical protein [Armatimonadota bacterium]
MIQLPWRLLLPASCASLLLSAVILPHLGAWLYRRARRKKWAPLLAVVGAVGILTPWKAVGSFAAVVLFGLGLLDGEGVGAANNAVWALHNWARDAGVYLLALAAVAALARWPPLRAAVAAAGLAAVGATGVSCDFWAPLNRLPVERGLGWSDVLKTDAVYPRAYALAHLPFDAVWPCPTSWPVGVALDGVPGFLPQWVTQLPPRERGGWARVVHHRASPRRPGYVVECWRRGLGLLVRGWAGEGDMLEVGAFYFPGWRAEVNGSSATCQPGPSGLVTIRLPGGHFVARVWYNSTSVARLGEAVSLSALVVWCWLAFAGILRRGETKGHETPRQI